jgi:hypothetical protein
MINIAASIQTRSLPILMVHQHERDFINCREMPTGKLSKTKVSAIC